MKEENKPLFNLFKEYRWMKELIEEKEAMSAQYANDPFLSQLNQGTNEELADLKDKVAHVDRKMHLVKDDKAYWMLNLLRQGHSAREVIRLMRTSSKTFYAKCDAALTDISKE